MAHQPTISWRASSDRQIFVSASTERAFASLMVLPASLMVLPTSLMVLPASLMVLGSAGSKRVNRHRWIFILASNRVAVRGWSSHSKDKRSRLDKVQSSWITGHQLCGRNKSWYGCFGVPVVTKTLAKLWIVHQTCAEGLESCITWC